MKRRSASNTVMLHTLQTRHLCLLVFQDITIFTSRSGTPTKFVTVLVHKTFELIIFEIVEILNTYQLLEV